MVSLSPSTTEAMFAIGAGDRLVGRSRHCDYPPEAARLPVVGGFSDPNLEAILALRPTLVIGSRGPSGPSLAAKLQGHQVDTFFPASDSVSDVGVLLEELGRRFGVEARATELRRQLDARVARIETWAKSRPPVTVLMVFDLSPIYVAGPGSFPDELLRRAGARNVVTEGGKWPTMAIERVLSLDPDVVLDATMAADGSSGQAALPGQRSRLADANGWPELRAVKEGRVRLLAGATALRPGPRIADGLAAMARAVHDQEPPP